MKTPKKARQYIYALTLFFMTMSGFGQMPVFKRYYIADIPGFGWLAEFYVTHSMHYMAAMVLMGFGAYVLFDFMFNGAGGKKITPSGYVKGGILFGLIVSGALMVIKNLPGIYFGHTVIIFLDIVHLSLCMILLCVSLFTLKKKWISKSYN